MIMRLKNPLIALIALAVFALATPASAASKNKPLPLRVLLITGGCCHDYAIQKDILKAGLEARAHVVVDQLHSDDKSNNPPLAFYGEPDYAKGYDVIIHDECAAKMADVKIVAGILHPHKTGIPGVNLHCAMHSYRTGNHREKTSAGSDGSMWFDYLGLQSSGHGPKSPIAIKYTKKHPITKTLSDWTTIEEELYNNIQIFPGATPLAVGHQTQKPRKGKGETKTKQAEAVVTWVNEYNGIRVFSTTIGHFNETVADDRYLELVTRGLLWTCDKLNEDYLK